MKIKILKCSRDTYWYRTHVGEAFECVYDTVAEEHDDCYLVWRNKCQGLRGYVMKQDCVVEKDEFEVKLTWFLEWFVKNDTETTPELIVKRYLEEMSVTVKS